MQTPCSLSTYTMKMKTKTILIIIGVVILLCVIGYLLFPVFVVIVKAIVGLHVFILVALGLFIGYLLSKILK